MKIAGILFICLFLLFLLLSSCGSPGQSDGATEKQGVTVDREQPSVYRDDIDLPPSGDSASGAPLATDSLGQAVYQRPVDKEALELGGKTDISTENIQFTYDELGRIITCRYLSDGGEVSLEYSYLEDGGIALIGSFRSSQIVDSVYYPTRGFDPALGFSAYDGYYFYGYGFGS